MAAVSGFLFRHGANITELDQHATDAEGGTFFLRCEFQTPHLDVSLDRLVESFRREVGEPFGMEWRVTRAAERKRMAILVSRYDHALLEILWRWKRGELHADVPVVVSNHPDLGPAVATFGVPFVHVPVTKETKADAEARVLALLDGKTDLIVLARYMQVLSPEFVARYPGRILNIHHSFLPAFAGASPYRQAYERGVKRIGATAHYVTEELDEGPIIEQDVVTVSHRQSAADLESLGRDIERQVLARAVRWHLEDRVIVQGRRTVVFV